MIVNKCIIFRIVQRCCSRTRSVRGRSQLRGAGPPTGILGRRIEGRRHPGARLLYADSDTYALRQRHKLGLKVLAGDRLELKSQIEGSRPQSHANVQLWLQLLGPFEARTADGTSALPISKKARALLCLVALHRPQALRRDLAAGLLWSAKPRDHAANSLRQALRELQIALAACGASQVLLTGGGRLALQNDKVAIDVLEPETVTARQPRDGILAPMPLCQDLRGLDPAFDAHMERLWKDLAFQHAFERPATDLTTDVTIVSDPASRRTGLTDQLSSIDRRGGNTPLNDEGVHGKGWRIAVIPFRNLGNTLGGGLSLGMAEEISAALSRFRMPRVIATGSFWDGSGPSADCLAKCRTFNLDYAISGTIQASGQRIRVTVSLVDVAMDFEVIWASRFDGTTDDLFTLQDTIASQTVAQIDPELLQRHQFRGEAAQQPNAAAHQAVLTAIQGIYRPDKLRFLEAKGLLDKAIDLDPNYADAYAWLAYWYVIGLGQGWVDDAHDAAVNAGAAAERAVALDPLDARGVTIAGHVKAYLLHDVEAALLFQQRAVLLNPNLPIAWALSAWTHIYCGRHREAVDHATMAESLSPADPHIFFVEHASMMAHLFLKDLKKADALAMSSLERKPRHASTLRGRLAILGHLGDHDTAASCLRTLQLIDPTVTVEKIVSIPPFRPSDMSYYRDGLRKAGVPDPQT